MSFLRSNLVVLYRWIALLLHDPISMVTVLVQPLLWLVLFGNQMSSITSGSIPGGSYIAFMTASSAVMTVFNSAIYGGLEMLFDREAGIFDRILASPISRVALITGRFTYIIGITTIQCALLFIGALFLGVRPAGGIPGVLVILVINALFCAGVTTVSMILAFVVPSHPQFFSIIGFAGLPILFLSSALVPLNRMPEWLRVISSLNPMTHAIEATRSLVITGWDFPTLGMMFGLLIGFDVAILLVASRIFSKSLGGRR